MNKANKPDKNKNSYIKGCPQQLFHEAVLRIMWVLVAVTPQIRCARQVALVQQPLAFSLDLVIPN